MTLTLAVVGRGRAAATLVPRWQAAGHTLVDQRSRRDGEGAAAGLAAADVIVLAVSDGAIAEVAAALATRPSAPRELWLHLSGALPAEALRDATRPGVPRAVGGLHPLVALTGRGDEGIGAVAGVEGEAPALPVALALARDAGLVPVRLGAGKKTAYHAAAVTVAGHATALFAQAMTLMAAAGIGPADARRALQPLLASAARNLAFGDPAEVGTGPIVRGDVATVAAHLAAIEDAQVAATYRLLALTQLALVVPRLDPATHAALVKLLDDGVAPG